MALKVLKGLQSAYSTNVNWLRSNNSTLNKAIS